MPFESKLVRPSVGLDHFWFAIDALFTIALVHTDHALISFKMNVGKNIAMVDCAGVRFLAAQVLAAQVIARSEISDLVPTRMTSPNARVLKKPAIAVAVNEMCRNCRREGML